MSTRILAGQRINENDKDGAVFYDGTDGLAFGPVFDNAEEAERFMHFIAGIDPSQLGGNEMSELYKLWLSCGRLAERPVVQIDASFLHDNKSEHGECLDCDGLIDLHRADGTHCDCGEAWKNGKCVADDGTVEWGVTCSLVEHCFPLFNGFNNNQVAEILRKEGVIPKGSDAGGDEEGSFDTESSCFYAYFKGKKAGEQFLDRLNGWLRDNWHKAYSGEKKPAKRRRRT